MMREKVRKRTARGSGLLVGPRASIRCRFRFLLTLTFLSVVPARHAKALQVSASQAEAAPRIEACAVSCLVSSGKRVVPDSEDPLEAWNRRLSAARLPVLRAFGTSLQSLAGRVALAEAAAELARHERAQARRGLFEARWHLLVRDPSVLSELRERIAGEADRLQGVASILDDLQSRLVAEPSINAELRAFVADPLTRHAFYRGVVGPQIDQDPLLAPLSRWLEKGRSGWKVSAQASSDLCDQLQRWSGTIAALAEARSELVGLAGEFAPIDPLHRALKSAVSEPGFGAYLISRTREGIDATPQRVRTAIRGYVSTYRQQCDETGAGLRLPADWRPRLEDGLGRYRRSRARCEELREQVASRAGRVVAEAGLADQLMHVVASDLYLFGAVAGAARLDPREVLSTYLKTMTFERSDGRVQVINHSEHLLKADLTSFRSILDENAGLLARIDSVLATSPALPSAPLERAIAGRLILEDAVAPVPSPAVDPITTWCRTYLAGTLGARVIRPDVMREVRGVLRRRVELERCFGNLEARISIDLSGSRYTKDHLRLLRSSAFYNPRTARGAAIYNDEYADHFAARIFGVVSWPLKQTHDFDSFVAFFKQRNRWVRALARTHDKLIIIIHSMPRWLSVSKLSDTLPGDGGWQESEAHSPRDMEAWKRIVRIVAESFKDVEGAEIYYEFWNEPDGQYWKEGMDEFLALYEATARTIKEVDPKAKVGGAAVNQWDGVLREDPNRGPINLELIRFTTARQVPLDFISWHHFGRPASAVSEAKEAYTKAFRACGRTDLPEFVVSEWAVPYRFTERAPGAMAELMLAFYRAGVDIQTVSAWEAFHEFPDPHTFAPWGLISQQGRKSGPYFVHERFDRLSRETRGIAVFDHTSENRWAGGRRAIVSRKEDGTYEILVWRTGYPPPLAAALQRLTEEGFGTADFRPYVTMERFEEAVRAGRSLDPDHAELFRQAAEAYRAAPDDHGWLVLEFPDAGAIELLESRSVRLDEHDKPIFTFGSRLAARLDRYEVLALRVRPRGAR